MSTFKRIISEKTRGDYGRKGGQGGVKGTRTTPFDKREAKAKIDNPQKYQTPSRGPRQVIQSPQQGIGFETNAPSGTVLGDKTPEQAFGEIDAKQKKRGTQPSSSRTQRQVRGFGKPDPEVQRRVADDLRGRKGTDPTARRAASNILGGGRKTPSGEELIGGETAKSGRGQRYRQARPADVKASGVKSNAYADWQRQAVRTKEQLKATGTKFFGKPTGVDAQGKPTYVPPKETPKGETGRRAQRQASPRSYASVKADLEAKTKIKELKVKPKASTKPPVLKPSTKVSAPQPTRGFSTFTQDVMRGKYTPQPQQQPNFRAPTPTKPTVSKAKVTGGTTRVTDLSPTKRPTGTKTFAQFATSGRTAAQKQATLKALRTSPKPAVQPKVTAPPKPQALTKAAVAPKVKVPKITAGGVAGGALSALGAGFDVVQGREDAKKAGASDTRAWLRGAARAAGGLVGGAVGASGGLVGGVAGYSVGSALADKTFTALAGATDAQKKWMKQANLASQRGTAVDKVKYRKGNQAVIYDPRVKKERIGTFDPTSGTFKAGNLAKSKAYTAKNPFERLGRQFSRSNEGSGLFGLNIVKGHGLADMAKKYYADRDEKARIKRVSDFKKSASAK
jgi:hypothetical protein|tara:strand:+ start:1258 stop:3117 length:1860 start_codon:yes stop_codon:yes gene_type:complete